MVLFWSALRRLRGCEVENSELDELLEEQAQLKDVTPRQPWDLFTDRSVRWQLISVMVISSAMQLCGNDSVRRINVMITWTCTVRFVSRKMWPDLPSNATVYN